MNKYQFLILAMYGGVALFAIVAGYVYKELRISRRNKKNPKLPFDHTLEERPQAARGHMATHF